MAEFLTVLGVTPALGRDFRHDDDRQGGDPRVVMVSDGSGAASSARIKVIGRPLRLNGVRTSSCAPVRFRVGPESRAAAALCAEPDQLAQRSPAVGHRTTARRRLIGGRQRGAAIAARLAREYLADNEGWTVRLVTLYDWLIPEARSR